MKTELKATVASLKAEHKRRAEELESDMQAEHSRMMADMSSSLKARFADVVLSSGSSAVALVDTSVVEAGLDTKNVHIAPTTSDDEDDDEDDERELTSSSESSPHFSAQEIEDAKATTKRALEQDVLYQHAKRAMEPPGPEETPQNTAGMVVAELNKVAANLKGALNDECGDPLDGGSCSNFKIDLKAPFGECVCGKRKEDHDESAIPTGAP